MSELGEVDVREKKGNSCGLMMRDENMRLLKSTRTLPDIEKSAVPFSLEELGPSPSPFYWKPV